jgi:hypothetical protein
MDKKRSGKQTKINVFFKKFCGEQQNVNANAALDQFVGFSETGSVNDISEDGPSGSSICDPTPTDSPTSDKSVARPPTNDSIAGGLAAANDIAKTKDDDPVQPILETYKRTPFGKNQKMRSFHYRFYEGKYIFQKLLPNVHMHGFKIGTYKPIFLWRVPSFQGKNCWVRFCG